MFIPLAVLTLLTAALTPDVRPVPPWATHVPTSWARSSNALMVTDLGACSPASALSTSLKGRHWKVMPYELTDGTEGRLVWASAESAAPELSVRLDAVGYYAIYVGMFGGQLPSRVLLRLDREAIAQSRAMSREASWNIVEELFYKVAELRAGTTLNFAQEQQGCGVAYVKLVPLSDEERRTFQADRRDRGKRTATATYDGLGILYHLPRSDDHRKALLGTIEGFRDSDFGTILLQYGGADQTPYPSKVAGHFGTYGEPEGFPEAGHRRWLEAFLGLKAAGVNPYKVLIDGIHDLGMKVQVSVRPAMWTFWEPYVDFFESSFYREHPEWRTVDRDGTPVTRMSWTVPEVRKHLIEVIMEAVRMGADGANVLFNRGFPVVLYEEPFVRMFQRRYGLDPRRLDEPDDRVVRMWSDVIVTFARELRQKLDEEERRRGDGGHLAMSVSCLGNEEDNMRYGLDVRRLVEEKLIDEVYPYKWDHGAKKRLWDIEYFSRFCKPAGVRLCPVLTAGYEFETQVLDALSFYEKGADGIGYWDASGMWDDMRQWSVMSRIGRPDELRRRDEVPGPTFIRIHLLNGQVLDGRYPPYMGG